jgi:DNA-binding response OmpR family regulator
MVHTDPSTQNAGTAPSILVVDNDARIVELVAWFLGKRGFEVRTSESFVQAREMLTASRPDLMLSDLDLGMESALEELPRLEEEGLLPPTLVVSGYLDADSTGRLESIANVRGTLSKPFDFADLEERVVTCLADLRREEAAQLPVTLKGGAIEMNPGGWVEIVPARPPIDAASCGQAPNGNGANNANGASLNAATPDPASDPSLVR